MKFVFRYHPLLVILHWLLAVLIVAMLGVGFFWLAATPNADPRKIGVLMWHMAGGMLILALTAVRLIVRVLTSKPADASIGHRALDRVAPIAHYGFYLLILIMVGTGLATAILARLNEIVFQGTGEPLPPDFAVYPSFVAHGTLAAILAGFIGLHAVAALYHQFVRRDRLLGRMAFGPRVSNPSAAE